MSGPRLYLGNLQTVGSSTCSSPPAEVRTLRMRTEACGMLLCHAHLQQLLVLRPALQVNEDLEPVRDRVLLHAAWFV